MALSSCFVKILCHGTESSMSSSFLGYLSCSVATCLDERPFSTLVWSAVAVSSTERRNGCLGKSAIIARRGRLAAMGQGAVKVGSRIGMHKAVSNEPVEICDDMYNISLFLLRRNLRKHKMDVSEFCSTGSYLTLSRFVWKIVPGGRLGINNQTVKAG